MAVPSMSRHELSTSECDNLSCNTAGSGYLGMMDGAQALVRTIPLTDVQWLDYLQTNCNHRDLTGLSATTLVSLRVNCVTDHVKGVVPVSHAAYWNIFCTHFNYGFGTHARRDTCNKCERTQTDTSACDIDAHKAVETSNILCIFCCGII